MSEDCFCLPGTDHNPTRVPILSVLAQKRVCVGDLAACPGMTASAISHQLRLLRQMRLVRRRREGKHIYYALDDDHVDGLFQQAIEHAMEQTIEQEGRP